MGFHFVNSIKYYKNSLSIVHLKGALEYIESIFCNRGGFHGVAILSLAMEMRPSLNLTISEDRFLLCILLNWKLMCFSS